MSDLLRKITEAREAIEAAEECMQRAPHPSVSDCGECYVSAKAAADILEEIERDLRSETISPGFSWSLAAEGICNPPGVNTDWHVFRHGWGYCVCGAKEWPKVNVEQQ